MVSELGDLFKAMNQDSQSKRAANRDSSAQVLTDNGINFQIRNNGCHLIVTHNSAVVDFWPGTGKWTIRGSGVYKRGVFRLLKAIKRLP